MGFHQGWTSNAGRPRRRIPTIHSHCCCRRQYRQCLHRPVIAAAIVVAIGSVLGAIRRLNQTGKHRWEGVSLLLVMLAMTIACFAAARWLSTLDFWQTLGPLLLFLGLLALLNAPVDWFSLGLTRALLRRGLELGGWWPYTLAIVDAALAAMLVWALAIFMVIGVQTFDSLAIAGGGNPVLPLAAIFNGTAVNPAPPNGISSNPTAPEYWWIYALLLSTMIPSLVDLAIGGTSLWRGVPGFPKLLLRFILPLVMYPNSSAVGSLLS
jgi:hypothetical protein